MFAVATLWAPLQHQFTINTNAAPTAKYIIPMSKMTACCWSPKLEQTFSQTGSLINTIPLLMKLLTFFFSHCCILPEMQSSCHKYSSLVEQSRSTPRKAATVDFILSPGLSFCLLKSSHTLGGSSSNLLTLSFSSLPPRVIVYKFLSSGAACLVPITETQRSRINGPSCKEESGS